MYMTRETPHYREPPSNRLKLGFLGSTNGAGASASAAGDAGIRIDHVLAIAFADGVHGTLFRAGAARDAIVINPVSYTHLLAPRSLKTLLLPDDAALPPREVLLTEWEG